MKHNIRWQINDCTPTHALNLGFEPLKLVFLSSYLKVFYIYELCAETAATFNTLKTKNNQKLNKIPLDKSLLKNFVSAEHGFPARSPLGRLFSAQVARDPGCPGNPGARSLRGAPVRRGAGPSGEERRALGEHGSARGVQSPVVHAEPADPSSSRGERHTRRQEAGFPRRSQSSSKERPPAATPLPSS